jgi:eukaryotic-like serine/threonine-protein kinase
MTPETWGRVKEIFSAALERSAADRATFLDSQCGTDASIRAEVESLLAAAATHDSLADTLSRHIQTRLRSALADRYRLERELGRGGMATVFLAHDVKHDRPVALKVLHPELTMALSAERFEREIRLAARLQHPHILSVYDSGESAGQLWFTMPYVGGESLRDRITREGLLPVDAALRIAREVAEALDYAHRHQVIHRDVKPENILLAEDHAFVADFGIARALEPSEPALTESGVVIGTPAYMSPEQASGSRAVDARTDIYALGCVLFEMLAGKPPFTGATPQIILARATAERPWPIHPIRQAVSPAIDAVIGTATQANPLDRYSSAAKLILALEPSQGGA